MLSISELFIYPIKSLGGIALPSAQVTERGLKYDRRWMLVDGNNEFISQRTSPEMALMQVLVTENGLLITHKKKETGISIPFEPEGSMLRVEVWGDRCKGIEVSERVSEWFSDLLSFNCRLVYMPDTTRRRVDTRYASNKEITNFTDGYPFTIIGQSSLDDLNQRLTQPLPINRFRPNIIFTGGAPFEEDELAHFTINNINFYGVKLCSRCVVITINQDEATRGKEPLTTLATYRKFSNKIYFGQNLLHDGDGMINIGDTIEVKARKKARLAKNIVASQ